MNTDQLFTKQKALRDVIIQKHQLEGKDLVPNMIVALNTEIGELANEWQGFKHWKVDPQPKPKMLEEYADGLSFILEIGLSYQFEKQYKPFLVLEAEPLDMFRKVYRLISKLDEPGGRQYKEFYYDQLFSTYLMLGNSLGFTWEQIEEAYNQKNQINHERQENGY